MKIDLEDDIEVFLSNNLSISITLDREKDVVVALHLGDKILSEDYIMKREIRDALDEL